MTLSPRNSRRNPMLREVDDLGDLCPRLEGEHRADLCIVGGGYLGLWTALEIKAAEPSMEICVIEADICGGGASGRNSGMALPWWTKIEALIAQCGTDEGLRLARASVTAIDEIAAFADTHRFDIEFARTGWLWGSTSPREDGRWGGIIDALDHHGEAHFAELDRAGVEALVDAPGFRGGALDAACATLHPAKLVRGLRRVALQRGVTIFEETAMTNLRRGSPALIETDAGQVLARRVVLAMNAWSTAVPELDRGIFILTSDDAVSDPVPDFMAQRRWADGPILTDSAVFVSGYRPMADGRVSAGVSGGAIAFGHLGRTRWEGATPRAGDIAAAFTRGFGEGHGITFRDSWRGPIDRTRSGLPLFGPLPGHPNIHYGYGFSGNGIVGCRIGAQIMTSLVLERDDPWSNSGLVHPVEPWMPREPIRYIGAHMVRQAIRRQDQLDRMERDAGPITRKLASLAPGGIVTTATD